MKHQHPRIFELVPSDSVEIFSGSGRVFSSGAADFGLNGSGMLVSSKVFKELELFRRFLSPAYLDTQSCNEEVHLRKLEALKDEVAREGVQTGGLPMRPFEASQVFPQSIPGDSAPAATEADRYLFKDPHASPTVVCGAYHCALLTAEGHLWLWGRNDCLQLSQEKIVSPYLFRHHCGLSGV